MEGKMTSPSNLPMREIKVEAPIPPTSGGWVSPLKYFGIVDLYNPATQELIDFKTTADPRQYAEEQALSAQLPLYAYAMEHNGFPVRSIRYRLLQRPNLRLKKNQTPDEYIEEIRQRVLSPDGHHEELRPITKDVMEHAKQLLASVAMRTTGERSGDYLPNRNACHKFGRPCEFLPLCLSRATGGDDWSLVAELYEQRNPGGPPAYISFSAMETFLNCERLFFWRYKQNLKAMREEDSEALTVGRTFHQFAEMEGEEDIRKAALTTPDDPASLKAAGMALAAIDLWGGPP